MDWMLPVFEFVVALAISGTAGYALWWSSKNGQLRDFERGAESIFDAEEPLGEMTDRFPARRRKTR